MEKFSANLNMSPSTSDIQNSDSLDKNKAPKLKCNKTFFPKPPISLQKRMLDDDDDIAYAKYGASHGTHGNPPLIFEAPKMELFLKAKKFYHMVAPIFKICDLEHEENQEIFTSYYIYYTQLFESLKI
ncbi:unnamed protein product [Gordionus sp. m RMFG-2023]